MSDEVDELARVYQQIEARDRELNEVREQQKATSEILRVISSSPTDLRPVFEAIVLSAARLCEATFAVLHRFDGRVVTFEAHHGLTAPEVEASRRRWPRPAGREAAVGRAILDRRIIHIHDVRRDPDYGGPQIARRTVLAVPLLREGMPVGAIGLWRREVQPFSEKEIELVKTFADQAVIAIENVRLFQEIQEKNEQLETASGYKSQFLANMSHELRTPLNGILGLTEMILDKIYGEVPERIRSALGDVGASGRHLLGLINDVLDLSKIEAGQMTLALHEYSMQEVVQAVSTAMQPLAAAKNLALKVHVPPDLPPGKGDQRRIAQVLMNLVGNAIKFVEAGEVRVEVGISDGSFLVSVSDSGPGIAPADQKKIFDEFQQADGSNSRSKGGTGLGLTIAKRIIEMHGGRIWLESKVGVGSTFTFTLPLRVERQMGAT